METGYKHTHWASNGDAVLAMELMDDGNEKSATLDIKLSGKMISKLVNINVLGSQGFPKTRDGINRIMVKLIDTYIGELELELKELKEELVNSYIEHRRK